MIYQTSYPTRFQTFQIGPRSPIQGTIDPGDDYSRKLELKTIVAASGLQYPQAVDQDDSYSLFNVVELPSARSKWVHAAINVPCWPPDPCPREERSDVFPRSRHGQLRLNVRDCLCHRDMLS